MKPSSDSGKKISAFLLDNIVTIIFVIFTVVGFAVSKGVSVNYFLNELLARFFRNGFLVLSLILPVVAGLGLNFGIVVGALAGMLAIIVVRFFGLGGLPGLLLCFLLVLPLAILFGYGTGKLYNKTRGQEMIASLIVGYFADGLYQFVVLFAIGVIIPVAATHPMIKPDGVGFRATFDMGAEGPNGLKYALDGILQIPFTTAIIILGACMLVYLIVRRILESKNPALKKTNIWVFCIYCLVCVAVIGIGIHAILTGSVLMIVRNVPVVTGLLIILLCLFTQYFIKTKIGQDFRSVGQSQHIAKVSGINVDRTRIIATIMSTVLAAWGMIIYLQNMGTVSTYTAHKQIGMFSVASLLVGGASTSKAGIKNALIGVILFHAMFILSPEIGSLLSGDEAIGEYTRSFMVYGVIGLSLGLYVWKTAKAIRDKNALE